MPYLVKITKNNTVRITTGILVRKNVILRNTNLHGYKVYMDIDISVWKGRGLL